MKIEAWKLKLHGKINSSVPKIEKGIVSWKMIPKYPQRP